MPPGWDERGGLWNLVNASGLREQNSGSSVGSLNSISSESTEANRKNNRTWLGAKRSWSCSIRSDTGWRGEESSLSDRPSATKLLIGLDWNTDRPPKAKNTKPHTAAICNNQFTVGIYQSAVSSQRIQAHKPPNLREAKSGFKSVHVFPA